MTIPGFGIYSWFAQAGLTIFNFTQFFGLFLFGPENGNGNGWF